MLLKYLSHIEHLYASFCVLVGTGSWFDRVNGSVAGANGLTGTLALLVPTKLE